MLTRRDYLKYSAAAGAALGLPIQAFGQARGAVTRRPIPSSGETLPIIGLGSSATFSRAAAEGDEENLLDVLEAMIGEGGSVFDTAPGYGESEEFTGQLVLDNDLVDDIFWATKLNVAGFRGGAADPVAARAQLDQSVAYYGGRALDLVQVHNVGDLATQFPILEAAKADGRIRYTGVTTTFKPQYETLETFLRNTEVDFIGIDYAVDNTDAEERIFPLCQDRGVGVLVYMPFGRTRLWNRVSGVELPAWAADFGAQTWAQFFLKFSASHPAVTVVTPATSKAHHMVDNMGAAYGRVPNAEERQRMIDFVAALPEA